MLTLQLRKTHFMLGTLSPSFVKYLVALSLYDVFPVPLGQFVSVTYPRRTGGNWKEHWIRILEKQRNSYHRGLQHRLHQHRQQHTCIMHQSIPLSCAQSPSPHGLLRGICPTLQSRGGTFAKFALPVGRAFANPGAIPELFTRTTGSFLSECNYTEDITEKKKSRLAHLSMTGGCKGKYACISSLLIKPEIHSEVGSYRSESTFFS